MTDEKRAGYIRALLKERAGAEQYGRTDKVAEIDDELRRLGAASVAPVKRAAKRTVKNRGE